MLALAVSLLLIVRFTVPAIYRGGSPIAVGAITVFAATAVTLLLLHGATVRALLAAGVTLAGEGTACMLSPPVLRCCMSADFRRIRRKGCW